MASLIARAHRSLAYRGLARSLRLLGRWGRFHLRHRFRVAAPQAFDLEFGVETSFRGEAAGERKGDVAGVEHGPTDPVSFSALMAQVEIGVGVFSFLDFGCGQGRALLLASEFPFRQIRGAEYDRALAQAAAKNLAIWTRHPSSRQRCRDFDAVWEDAAAWEFPIAPSVFYLNEPFHESLMRVVAGRIRHSLMAAPRPALVFYLGGRYAGIWEESGDFDLVFTRGDDRIYRWKPGEPVLGRPDAG